MTYQFLSNKNIMYQDLQQYKIKKEKNETNIFSIVQEPLISNPFVFKTSTLYYFKKLLTLYYLYKLEY